MRNLTWIIISLIVLVWVAIAIFWTGPKTTSQTYDFPEAIPTLSPAETTPTISLSPVASPSAEASSTSPVQPISPVPKSNLNY